MSDRFHFYISGRFRFSIFEFNFPFLIDFNFPFLTDVPFSFSDRFQFSICDRFSFPIPGARDFKFSCLSDVIIWFWLSCSWVTVLPYVDLFPVKKTWHATLWFANVMVWKWNQCHAYLTCASYSTAISIIVSPTHGRSAVRKHQRRSNTESSRIRKRILCSWECQDIPGFSIPGPFLLGSHSSNRGAEYLQSSKRWSSAGRLW